MFLTRTPQNHIKQLHLPFPRRFPNIFPYVLDLPLSRLAPVTSWDLRHSVVACTNPHHASSLSRALVLAPRSTLVVRRPGSFSRHLPLIPGHLACRMRRLLSRSTARHQAKQFSAPRDRFWRWRSAPCVFWDFVLAAADGRWWVFGWLEAQAGDWGWG